MSTTSHLSWLKKSKNSLTTACGKKVDVFDFTPNYADKAIFSSWAKHFRNHYCLDSEIDGLKNGTPFTRAQYLENIKFPSKTTKLGPSIRSGDFAEILISDFVEYALGFWVPRTRYADKTIRDESTKGTDLIGFKSFQSGKVSPKDILTMFEVKAQLSASGNKPRLQEAIDDSAKDPLRIGESLNAIKQRLMHRGKNTDADKVSRYQSIADKPYLQQFGAVAILETKALDPALIVDADTKKHAGKDNLSLMVIVIDDAMTLVHHLYKVAADEA